MLYGGTYDADFFSRSGPVGQWFSATGQVKYAREPEIKTLAEIQQELNTKATEMSRLYNSGKIDDAHKGLKTVELKSEQFLELLSQLEKRLVK